MNFDLNADYREVAKRLDLERLYRHCGENIPLHPDEMMLIQDRGTAFGNSPE